MSNTKGQIPTLANFTFAFLSNVPAATVTAAGTILTGLQSLAVPGSGVDDRLINQQLGVLEAALNAAYGGSPATPIPGAP